MFLFNMSIFYKKILFFFLLFFNINLIYSQSSFYIGLGHLSTFAQTILNSNNNQSHHRVNNLSNFSLHYGNITSIKKIYNITSEIFYLNNNIILGINDNNIFELHQNIGFALKPGFSFNRHNFSISAGMFAVYIFDKDVVLGYQLDRFDDSLFYGFDYRYNMSKDFIFGFSLMKTNFESISHYTNYTLKSFSVLNLTLNYLID